MTSHSSESTSGAPRKGMILRCDKPRYDGGVELNLERYLGRPLQPSSELIKQKKLAMLQEALLQEKQRLLNEETIKAAIEAAHEQLEAMNASTSLEPTTAMSSESPVLKKSDEAAESKPVEQALVTEETPALQASETPEVCNTKTGFYSKLHSKLKHLLVSCCLAEPIKQLGNQVLDAVCFVVLTQLTLVLALRYQQAESY